jgi:2-polyprenyl-3-methyl-5-hydroxy-6-metoxy-1,4-benzoquinol methylase
MSKNEIIINLVKNKNVLDIGCVQHSWDKSLNKEWMHGILVQHAKYVFGVDILADDIKILKEQGYNVGIGDAENFSLGFKFDVIYAGEIIEHLGNQGLFLKCCKKHLKNDGVLVITTVNCFSLLFFYLYFRRLLQVNNEHTCWYDEITLKQLLSRFGFSVEKVYYLHAYKIGNSKTKRILSDFFKLICPRNMRDNLLFICKLDKIY